MRHVGEPVAVVLADDPHVAERAVQLIEADYEELPAVYDEVEAMTSHVIVHDDAQAGRHLRRPQAPRGPHARPMSRSTFSSAAATSRRASRDADHVLEHTFRSPQTPAPPLEPFVSVAEPGDDGITIHTATQTPSFVRLEIARLLGWPENKVRVKVPLLGGGFGAKIYIKLEALVAALALIVRRPVKISRSPWRSSSTSSPSIRRRSASRAG